MMGLAKSLFIALLGLRLLTLIYGQLDLPQPTETTAPENLPPNQAAPDIQSNPPHHQQQQPQFYNNPNYDFNRNPQQQFRYNFPPPQYVNKIDPIHQFQYQPHPNSLFQPYDKNGTNPEQFNNFGGYDNNFGQGNFGYDPYGPYRQQDYPGPIPFRQQSNLNLGPSQRATQDGQDVTPTNPNAEQIPQQPGYQQNPQIYSQQPQFVPLNPNQHQGPYPFPQQFPTFRPNHANFDYGYPQNVAPPQIINRNLLVVGQNGHPGGPPGGPHGGPLGGPQGGPLGGPQGGPVVGFYGPSPNLRNFVYPPGQPQLQTPAPTPSPPLKQQQQPQQQLRQHSQQQDQYHTPTEEEAPAAKPEQAIVIK